MKRRGFLGSLLALPFVPNVLSALERHALPKWERYIVRIPPTTGFGAWNSAVERGVFPIPQVAQIEIVAGPFDPNAFDVADLHPDAFICDDFTGYANFAEFEASHPEYGAIDEDPYGLLKG